MKNYLYNYIKYINKELESDKKTNYEKLLNEHLNKIKFFQHERLIHLIVTISFALFTILFTFIALKHPYFWSVVIILLICLMFYIIHYYRLENGVQYLYQQYDKIKNKVSK